MDRLQSPKLSRIGLLIDPAIRTKENTIIIGELQECRCGLVSLGESWCDTTTDVGRLMLTTMGGIAEFERGLIRKRCQDGIDRAKAKGTKFVRKAVLYKGKRERIAERYANGETMSELARRTIALQRPPPNRRLYVPQLVRNVNVPNR